MERKDKAWNQLSLSFEKDSLRSIIEVLLFISNEPLSAARLSEFLGDFYQEEDIKDVVVGLMDEYSQRASGIRIYDIGGGYRMGTDPTYDYIIRRFKLEKKRVRLSMAALETLAIIAYRQPITTPEIENLRGVSVSSIVKNLLEKRLVRIMGRKKTAGKPLIYGTTKEFLEYFGLSDLQALPSIDEFFETYEGSENIVEDPDEGELGLIHRDDSAPVQDVTDTAETSELENESTAENLDDGTDTIKMNDTQNTEHTDEPK